MTEQNPKVSFIRRQSITIGQLTYAINLFLTFSVATFGFQITLFFNDKFNPTSWPSVRSSYRCSSWQRP
jgi:hypothetical protein